MQGVVIQGPTNYYKEVLPSYINTPNTVWSTWEDEPADNIREIEKYIPVVLNKKPSFPGYLNINMQTTTTIGGLKYLEERGVTEVLKTRGDIKIPKLNLFLSLVQGQNLSFLALCKEGVRTDLYYELIYPHYSHDYPVDLVVYGAMKNMIQTFDFVVNDLHRIPPEAVIVYNYLSSNGLEFKLEYEYLKKRGINFFLADCVANSISMEWVKHNNGNIVEWHNTPEYEF